MDDPVIHRCRPHLTEANRAKLERVHLAAKNADSLASTSAVAATTYLGLKIHYVVIPMDANGSIALSQIQAQHGVINTHYATYQQVSGTNNTAHYPYFEAGTIMGHPYITFAPADASQVTAEYLSIPSPLPSNGGFATVAEAEAEYKAQGGTVVAGTIYVYITTIVDPAVSGTILGMAQDIIANALMIHPGTVGSSSKLGSLGAQYGAGKTLVHELGHCFGLLHPFSDTGSCSDTVTQAANPQSPPQKNPNFYTSLTPLNTTGNCLDNRGRDQKRFCTGDSSCQSNTVNGLNPGDSNPNVAAYSCASRTELTESTLGYETFMIFMDYGDDTVAVGFPTSAVSTMRTVIQSHPSLFEVSVVTPTTTAPVPTVTPDDSSFPTWAIIVIAVVGGLIVLAIVASVLAKGSVSKAAVRSKNLSAYQQPFMMKRFV